MPKMKVPTPPFVDGKCRKHKNMMVSAVSDQVELVTSLKLGLKRGCP